MPPDRLTTAVSEELAATASFLAARATAAEEAVGRAVGAHQAAMQKVGRGPAELELAMRYEGHVSREMEGVLRLYMAVTVCLETVS